MKEDSQLEYDHMMHLFDLLNKRTITEEEMKKLKEYRARFDRLAEEKIDKMMKKMGR